MRYAELEPEWRFVICITVLAGLTTALGFAAGGCSHSIDHDLTIGIDFDDECAFTFPECVGEETECVDSDGTKHPECIVACVYARELICTPDGPDCVQSFGEDDVSVPVVCRPRDLM